MRPQRWSARSFLKSDLTRFKRRHLGNVLGPPPAQIHHPPALHRRAVAHQPSKGVRRLERGDDAFALAQAMERFEREIVAAVVVLDAPALLQIGMLRADGRIVKTGGY